MSFVDAAVLWTAVSIVVSPFVGSCLARRRVELASGGLVTASSDRGAAAAFDP